MVLKIVITVQFLKSMILRTVKEDIQLKSEKKTWSVNKHYIDEGTLSQD